MKKDENNLIMNNKELTNAEKYQEYIKQYRLRKYNYLCFSIEKSNELVDLFDNYIEKERRIYEEKVKEYIKKKESMERELENLEKEKKNLLIEVENEVLYKM